MKRIATLIFICLTAFTFSLKAQTSITANPTGVKNTLQLINLGNSNESSVFNSGETYEWAFKCDVNAADYFKSLKDVLSTIGITLSNEEYTATSCAFKATFANETTYAVVAEKLKSKGFKIVAPKGR